MIPKLLAGLKLLLILDCCTNLSLKSVIRFPEDDRFILTSRYAIYKNTLYYLVCCLKILNDIPLHFSLSIVQLITPTADIELCVVHTKPVVCLYSA